MSEHDSGYWEGPQIVLCARKAAHLTALCGAAPFTTLWTNKRRQVGCPGCITEIERRLAARQLRRRPTDTRS